MDFDVSNVGLVLSIEPETEERFPMLIAEVKNHFEFYQGVIRVYNGDMNDELRKKYDCNITDYEIIKNIINNGIKKLITAKFDDNDCMNLSFTFDTSVDSINRNVKIDCDFHGENIDIIKKLIDIHKENIRFEKFKKEIKKIEQCIEQRIKQTSSDK